MAESTLSTATPLIFSSFASSGFRNGKTEISCVSSLLPWRNRFLLPIASSCLQTRKNSIFLSLFILLVARATSNHISLINLLSEHHMAGL
ncbi:hypothetical protein H6P81_008728 [Aristolochia fimbriata]|uniref:Uncharacterized protein n=1 Tax=Aristolochia fimbriata TaxID=158543 RepID=A0AAV7EIV6_ARIFI|nr:hypothetical protein H6P81_008728 [Aristolochia fimbriata]